jgi:hypothetical protein
LHFPGSSVFYGLRISDGKPLPSVKMFSHWHLVEGLSCPDGPSRTCLIFEAFTP